MLKNSDFCVFFQVWSFTSPNGASLLRLTSQRGDVNDFESEITKIVQQLHSKHELPEVFDVHNHLPSLKELDSSLEKLQELTRPGKEQFVDFCIVCCFMFFVIVASSKEIFSKYSTWLSQLENTGWLQIISKCLSVANSIVNTLFDLHKFAIIKGWTNNVVT